MNGEIKGSRKQSSERMEIGVFENTARDRAAAKKVDRQNKEIWS